MPTQEEKERSLVLLQHMRNAAGEPDLQFMKPPKAIVGGLSGAAICGFELDSLDERFSGAKVLRISVNHNERERTREISLQDAANRISNLAPAVRLTQKEDIFGGVFFVMDRLPGGTLWRWYWALVAVSIVVAIMVSQPLIVLLGYLFGVITIGVVMEKQRQLLRAIPLNEVKDIYGEYGIQDAEASSTYWLSMVASAIDNAGLTGYSDGHRWLEEHAFVPSRQGLCLGDFHPGNCMCTWTRITGLVDWEMACIADPELDVGALRYLVTLAGPLVLPIYWVFRICSNISGARFDAQRINYYEAQRILYNLSMLTRARVDYDRQLSAVESFPKPFPGWFLKLIIWTHSRRFLKLTGIKLIPPNSLL